MLNNFSFEEYKNQKLKEKIEKSKYPTKHAFHFFTFYHAFNGFKWALHTQPNLKVEMFFGLVTAFFSAILSSLNLLSVTDILFIVLAIFMVLVTELLNTAVEALGDEIANNNYREFIRIAKDVAAAAVTASVLFALVVACFTIFPKLPILFNLFFY